MAISATKRASRLSFFDPFAARLIGALVVLLVLIWAGLGFDYWRLQQLHLVNARTHAEGVAQAMDERVGRTIQTVEVVLRAIEQSIRQRAPHGEVSAIEEILHGIDPHFDEVVTISFDNSQGVGVVNSNPSVPTGHSYAGSDFFRIHVENPKDGTFFISSPIIGPASGKRVFLISRRVAAADGRFLGALVAAVSTDPLASKFAAERIGERGTIALFHIPSKKILVRQPEYERTFGETLKLGRLFDELAGAPTGAFESPSSFDGEKRFFVYRQLAGTPLALAIGISVNEIEGQLKNDLFNFWIVAALLTVAIVAVAAGILVAHRRQMRIQETLDTSEIRFRTLSEVSTVGVFHTNSDGDCIYVNAQWSEITGLSLDEAMGKGWMKALHPDDGPQLGENWYRCAKNHVPFKYEYRFLRPNGEIRWVLGHAKVEVNKKGRVTARTGTITDITEKKNTEELVRKQEEEVRALVENSPDLISRFDREGRCIYANSAVEMATGLPREEILGKTYEEVRWPDDAVAKWMPSIKKVFITGLMDTFDFSLPTPAGERHFQVRLVPEFGPDGGALNVVAVARDISVIKGGEAVLHESEQRIHGITANTPGMVFQCVIRARDGALLFTYVSEGSMLLIGLTPGEIQANRNAIPERIVEQDCSAFHASLRHSASSMEVWNWEGRMSFDHGEEKWINCRATPRSSSDGDVIWEGVMFNITEGKRAEEEIRQSRQLLRDLSAHMESVREEERKRIAREVHDELGQALTVLRMDVSLLRLSFGGQSPQLMERIHSMKDGVDRTIRIVRHVTSTLRPVALDLGLMAALEWLVEEFTNHTGINCQLKTGGCEEIVLDDARATALFRIVQESLTNVAKHAEASEAEVSIEPENDREICLEIHDNGKGFVPGSTRKTGSFGLIGMRERALMLGGTVEIRSILGSGTCVEVCIPLEKTMQH